MKTDIVAPAGGLLILAGGIALALYTATNAPVLEQSRAKAVEKYVNMSEKALVNGDRATAEKFAKKALGVDATDKTALAEFKKVVLASCPAGAQANPTNSENPAGPQTPEAAKPDTETEDEMGCI